MLSYVKGKINLFTIVNNISPVWSQMETIFDSYLRRVLMLILIAAGVWIINLYISSRRTFARVRRLSSHSEGSPDHVCVRRSGISLATSHLSLWEVSSPYSCPRSSTSTNGHRDGKPNTTVRTTTITLIPCNHCWYSIQRKQLRYHLLHVYLSNPKSRPNNCRSECHQGIAVKIFSSPYLLLINVYH